MGAQVRPRDEGGLSVVRHIEVSVQSVDRYTPFVGQAQVAELKRLASALSRRMTGHVVWNLNSTEKGGGVAEILHSHIGFVRGLGIDARWSVIDGPAEFFRITKRLHNALHGAPGDASSLDESARRVYEQVLHENLLAFVPRVREGDLILLHDPQLAGMIPALSRMNVRTVWRCHIGSDLHVPEVERGWAFLRPYLGDADRYVFTRMAYVPPYLDKSRVQIVTPTVDPTSSKNVELPGENARAILALAGIIEGSPDEGVPVYLRDDGTHARVERSADIIRQGRAPAPNTPLVTQVSRWDALKDPMGVMAGFARLVDPIPPGNAELVLAGPSVHAVADDPEGAEVFGRLAVQWRELPHQVRSRIHLINLPMEDVEENAAIVNALQRHSAVVVQKSLREGFGLTVAEAMWKARPVIASAVGGIQDQIEDGKSGLLLRDPRDIETFSALMAKVLENPNLAQSLGANARERIREKFLGLHSLYKYEQLAGAMLDLTATKAREEATTHA